MRTILTLAVAVVTVPLLAANIWYAVSFQPRLGELHALALRGREAAAGNRPVLYRMAVAAGERIRQQAMMEVYDALEIKEPASEGSRHVNGALWYSASYVGLTEEEVFDIWVQCTPHDCDGGLERLARKHFDSGLAALSDREAAQLVAMLKAPALLKPGTERGEQRANEILAKAAQGGF